MPNKTIDDLRAHLFATLEGLRDKDNPLDLERAKAIADVSRVMVETAKVEATVAVAYMYATGQSAASPFLPGVAPQQKTLPTAGRPS